MSKYRGLTKESKRVYGDYIHSGDTLHYIIPTDAIFTLTHGGLLLSDIYAIDPETVCQFVCKDKNDQDVWQGDKVWLKRGLKRGGFERVKCTAIAGFKDWVWIYWKNHSTYHWDIAYYEDIELIKTENHNCRDAE